MTALAPTAEVDPRSWCVAQCGILRPLQRQGIEDVPAGLDFARRPVPERVEVSSASARGEHAAAGFHGFLESLLHRPESLDELELLAFRSLAVDQGPAVRLALSDLVGVRVEWSGLALLFRCHCDHAMAFT